MKNKGPKLYRCVVCPQVFNRKEAVCWRCGCCQKCKLIGNSRFATVCMHCGNHINAKPYNKTGPKFIVHIHPVHPRA